MFRPHFKHPRLRGRTKATFTPTQVAALYGFPTGATGATKHVAVIELAGDFSQQDLDRYFKNLGLPRVNPVIPHLIDGATRKSDPNGADAEVMLDLCVIGAIAPGVQLHCYFAPNTDLGFLDAINQAIKIFVAGGNTGFQE